MEALHRCPTLHLNTMAVVADSLQAAIIWGEELYEADPLTELESVTSS